MLHELTMIVPEELSTNDIETLRKMVSNYGKVRKSTDNGVKLLAYPIHKYGMEYAYGRYLYMELELDKVTDICEMLNTNSMVLRYLLVKADTNFIDRR